MSTDYSPIKIFFLLFHGFSVSNGISKKILGQIKGLEQNGAQMTFCYYTVDILGHRVWKINDDILIDFGTGGLAKVRKRIDYRAIVDYVLNNNFSLVYIRSYHNANPFTIHMIKCFKSMGVKVIMEIPTFPYDQEYSTPEMKMQLAIDRLFRKKNAKIVDAIVTFSDQKEIFGQSTIQISNGIDFERIKIRTPIIKEESHQAIHLLAVAEIHYWHGYDRLIKGLAAYYKKSYVCEVYFHLVGGFSGDRERAEISIPIQEYGLEDHVILYGPLDGLPLDKLFDLANLAIGSLGRHRTGIEVIRTLKNREYAARGIPFIYSETDPDFEGRPYIHKVKADESPIDIDSLVKFSKQCSILPKDIRNSILHLSWKSQMKIVLDQVFENADQSKLNP